MADRIVEVYSAADAVEAHGLCQALQQAGIEARVVGDTLANAAGGLPLGETIRPRIWVREADQSRARGIIAEWAAQSAPQVTAPKERDIQEEEADPDAEEQDQVTTRSGCARVVSVVLAMIAAACIVFSVVRAWRNYVYLWKWRTTEAACVGRQFGSLLSQPTAATRDLPIPQKGGALIGQYDLKYAYVAEGVTYLAELNNREEWDLYVTIYYNPKDPAQHVVGPVMPPGWCLFFGIVIGAFLLMVAWQFR